LRRVTNAKAPRNVFVGSLNWRLCDGVLCPEKSNLLLPGALLLPPRIGRYQRMSVLAWLIASSLDLPVFEQDAG